MKPPILDTSELETAFLAALLEKPEAYFEVLGSVAAEDFSDPLYSEIWHQMGVCMQQDGNISAVALHGRLMSFREPSFDPAVVLARLGRCVITTSGIPNYAKQIREAARLRRLADLGNRICRDVAQSGLGTGEVDQITASTIQTALEIGSSTAQPIGFTELGDRLRSRLEAPPAASSTGFPRLDKALGGGFYPGRVYGICAPKKAGKTTFLSSIAYNLVENAEPWAYIALEMGADEIFERMLARRMGINASDFLSPDIRNQQHVKSQLETATKWFEQSTSVFRPRPGMPLDELIAFFAQIALKRQFKGVFVDYLQLIGGRPKATSETYWLDTVAQALAEAAKRHQVWVVVAAQLGRQDTVYGGDGLGRACDINMKLSTIDQEASQSKRAWIQMLDSRYTNIRDVGGKTAPAYELEIEVGPYFRELPLR
ncbi:DnaB-like helicase C-terminal domain-containing protein [Nisaea sp.]|uniref:DnaB-like helicase C-terminal domain-containing protein n=1 Tax=Nisaea sp. TaxID=2024842 RepID=UPI002B273984|nr:DnaB-like helicase C-terminal domain-containing protein [Nisaea sp.]